MSERGYFSFRYAIPGYTFILLVIAINHVPLLKILETANAGEAFGAFLAFLSLFAGSAIGFLISQFWWWWSKRKPLLGTNELKSVAREIFKKYFLTTEEFKDNIDRIGAIFEYIMRVDEKESVEEKKRFLELATRRWDMYHTLSSTFHTLWIALAVGIGCRIYFEYFLLEPLFSIPIFSNTLQVLNSASSLNNAEAVALMLVFMGVCVLLIVFRHVRQKLLTEYCPLLKAFVIKSMRACTKKEIREVFPDFPTKNQPK